METITHDMLTANTVNVPDLPNCDFCGETAQFDGATRSGHWAYMCMSDFKVMGIGLGTGRGQHLVTRVVLPTSATTPKRTKRRNWVKATLTGTYRFVECPVCTEYYAQGETDKARQGNPSCWNDLDAFKGHVDAKIKRTRTRRTTLKRTFRTK